MWDQGDFNYDGSVNAEDFTLFSANLSQSAVLAAQAGVIDRANGISFTNVPEPAWRGDDGDGWVGNFSAATTIIAIGRYWIADFPLVDFVVEMQNLD